MLETAVMGRDQPSILPIGYLETADPKRAIASRRILCPCPRPRSYQTHRDTFAQIQSRDIPSRSLPQSDIAFAQRPSCRLAWRRLRLLGLGRRLPGCGTTGVRSPPNGGSPRTMASPFSVPAAIHGLQLAAARRLITTNPCELVPGPMARGIQIDPSHQSVPSFGTELHAVVSLLEHLHQSGCVGMKLHGRQQMQITLETPHANLLAQLDVALRKQPECFSAQLVQRRVLVPYQVGVTVLVAPDNLGC